MSERDLRALDMRHTLPNLKNLLLTLGHDAVFNFECVFVSGSRTMLTSAGWLGGPLRRLFPTVGSRLRPDQGPLLGRT